MLLHDGGGGESHVVRTVAGGRHARFRQRPQPAKALTIRIEQGARMGSPLRVLLDEGHPQSGLREFHIGRVDKRTRGRPAEASGRSSRLATLRFSRGQRVAHDQLTMRRSHPGRRAAPHGPWRCARYAPTTKASSSVVTSVRHQATMRTIRGAGRSATRESKLGVSAFACIEPARRLRRPSLALSGRGAMPRVPTSPVAMTDLNASCKVGRCRSARVATRCSGAWSAQNQVAHLAVTSDRERYEG